MQNQGYKYLIVWQKAMQLVKLVYNLSDQLPSTEKFGLISQMLRSAISIPSNIAEGWARNRKPEFVRFLEIAYASGCEIETQLLISKDRYLKINHSKQLGLLIEVQKMLNKLTSNNK